MFWEYLLLEKNNPGYGTERWAYLNPWVMLLKTTNCYHLDDRFTAYSYGDSRVRNNVFSISDKKNDISNVVSRIVNFRDNYELPLSSIALKNLDERDYRLTDDTRIYEVIPGFTYCDVDRVGVGK